MIFGRESAQETALVEFRILGNNSEAPLARQLPDDFVVGPLEAEVPDVRGSWVERSHYFNQAVGEILVK